MPHTSPENAPTPKRVLNPKAVLIIVGCGILLYLLSGWIHSKQILKTSAYLKAAAEQALADDEPSRAFDHFELFLALNPGDAEAEDNISKLLEEHGTGVKALVRAYQINETLLRKDKARDDLRIRQIRIAERTGRYADASGYLETLRKKQSPLSEVWHFSGIVARDTGDFANAIQYFEKAIALENPSPKSFEFLAALKTSEAKDPVAAKQLLNQMVSRFETAESFQIRAAWSLEQQQPKEALRDLWLAAKAEPADLRTNALLIKAIRMAGSSDHNFDSDRQYESVIKHLIRVLEDDPDQHKLRLYLSSALWAIGKRDAAIGNLEFGIQRDPRQFEMQEVLLDYLVSDQHLERAQQVFANIPEGVVDRGRHEFMRGRLLMAQKQWQQAIDALELAIGYAHEDDNMASRAHICLALCRRELGDNIAAMEEYRSLIQSNPDFEGGRLGMASAYLQADQLSLAIAEYRQLLHVEGVPAFVANLMIQHTLSQPPGSRDWTELRTMLRDDDPIVTDEVQRILLQADLLFAEGFPAKAMDKLDYAARKMPDRPEIQRAYERLSSVHGDSLRLRVLRLLDEDPTNQEGHISLLRLLVARQDNAGIESWLKNMLSGSAFPGLGQGQRIQIVAGSATAVLETELMTRGSSIYAQTLRKYAVEAWRQLAAQSKQHLHSYVRFIAAHQSVGDAMNIVRHSSNNTSPKLQASCWLACLRYGQQSEAVKIQVNNELVKLIKDDPGNLALRLAYADNKILLQQYDQAESVLNQIAGFDKGSGLALGRLAWIALLIKGDEQTGLTLSEQAAKRSPSDPTVRNVRGLALAESKRTTEALEVLTSIPKRERSIASYLFEARALSLAGRTKDAEEMVREISARPTRTELDSAEANLLRLLQQELQVQPRQMTQSGQ